MPLPRHAGVQEAPRRRRGPAAALATALTVASGLVALLPVPGAANIPQVRFENLPGHSATTGLATLERTDAPKRESARTAWSELPHGEVQEIHSGPCALPGASGSADRSGCCADG